MPQPQHLFFDYRYGFGGHEKDDEVSGNSNHLAFGDYGYNPRLGRRFNIDPMVHEFPWMSPYATFNNNPIYFNDPTGLAPEGGPGDREINQGINSNHPTKQGKPGTTGTSNGRNVVYADVSEEARLGKFANAFQIAKAYEISEDLLYSYNPGLKENKNTIGQGQLIFVSAPNAAIMNNEESQNGVSIADKSPVKDVFDPAFELAKIWIKLTKAEQKAMNNYKTIETDEVGHNDFGEGPQLFDRGNMPASYGRGHGFNWGWNGSKNTQKPIYEKIKDDSILYKSEMNHYGHFHYTEWGIIDGDSMTRYRTFDHGDGRVYKDTSEKEKAPLNRVFK